MLQLLLLGQPEFKQVLADHEALEQLRQRVIAAHHLQAMEPSEIEPYIKHRLECVGWEGNPEFDDDLFAALYDATGGIPRRVNQVATRLLLLGAIEQRTRIDKAMLASVMKEMNGDSGATGPKANDATKPNAAPAPGPVKHITGTGAEPSVDFQKMLEHRDAQIEELQQAVIELSHAVAGTDRDADAELHDRIEKLDAKLVEQEHAVRHVLTMLIEWVETGEAPRAAA